MNDNGKKDLEGSSHDLVKVQPQYLHGGTGKP
jgi:hypothetical protein